MSGAKPRYPPFSVFFAIKLKIEFEPSRYTPTKTHSSKAKMNRYESPKPTRRDYSMPPPAPRRQSASEAKRQASDDICAIFNVYDESQQQIVFDELVRLKLKATEVNIATIIGQQGL
jgi:hypothetical protein